MWIPILITVLAAAGNNIGKVLQKQATRTLPRLTLQGPVLVQYFSSRTWVLGTAADLGGALLMIVAFAYAPVSVVQPVSAVGLVILLIFSHFYLKERLKMREWCAAGVAFLGVLGLGMSAEPDHLDHPDHMHPLRIIAGFAVMVAMLAIECWWRHGGPSHSPHGQRQLGGGSGGTGGGKAGPTASVDALLCGLEGGACFGFSAAACRTGFILAKRVSWVWAPLGLLGSVVLTSSGFVLQTRGLKAGNTVVVCTMAAVASMVTGVLAGLLALGEKMPSSHHMRLARLFAWAAILAGVSSLAGGSDGLGTALRALSTLVVNYGPTLPRWVWRVMPRSVSQALHKAQKKMAAAAQEDGQLLPLVQPVDSTGGPMLQQPQQGSYGLQGTYGTMHSLEHTNTQPSLLYTQKSVTHPVSLGPPADM